jgi:hypothetical protein
MLIKIHVLYPNGIPEGEEPPEAENNGWHCEDTWGTNGVYSLDGISSELIDSLDESDAGNTVLTISSTDRVMHMPNMATIGPSTKMMTADASVFAAVNEKDKIKIFPGASVSLIGGNSHHGLQEQNDRRLITSTDRQQKRQCLWFA